MGLGFLPRPLCVGGREHPETDPQPDQLTATQRLGQQMPISFELTGVLGGGRARSL